MGPRNRRVCRLSTALAACALAFALAAPVLGESAPAASAPASPPTGAQVVEQGWFAPVKRSVPPAEPKNVFIIPIREDITDKAFRAMERKVITCKAGGADLVILDMHTPGGDPFAARDIIELLTSELGDVHTVCFVRSDALSAGAMIALGCNEIVMTLSGTLGACAPILVGGGELKGAKREKYESFLRTTFEQSAKRNGYPVALAVSMVSYDMEVWLVRNKKTRELQYGLRGQWRGRVTIPPGLADVKSNPNAQWELVEVPVRKGRLLTVDADKAMAYSLASAIVEAPKDRPFDAIMERYNAGGEPTVLIDTWSEDLVDVIRSPVVAMLLVFAGLMFGYIEMHTPGFGLFGAISIVCFAIILGSGYLVGLAQAWEIALFVLGLVLIGIEIFVIPGFGVVGIAGALCCIAGLLSLLVAIMGPWTFDLIHVPSEYPCSAPFIRLEGDFCGTPMSGGWILVCVMAVLLCCSCSNNQSATGNGDRDKNVKWANVTEDGGVIPFDTSEPGLAPRPKTSPNQKVDPIN